jgi:hypothetical protein
LEDHAAKRWGAAKTRRVKFIPSFLKLLGGRLVLKSLEERLQPTPRWQENPMKRVIIESPFAGDIQTNLKYVRQACTDCINRGEVPFASHMFFPQFLDDNDPKQRQLGIEMGYDFWEKADLVVFYTDFGISPGMEKALAKAFLEGKPYVKRALGAAKAPPSEAAAYAPKPRAVDLDKLEHAIKNSD